jgi:hypothetical protein
MIKDIQFALRQRLKQPGFTLIAVVTVALAIGASTAVLSHSQRAVGSTVGGSSPGIARRVNV